MSTAPLTPVWPHLRDSQNGSSFPRELRTALFKNLLVFTVKRGCFYHAAAWFLHSHGLLAFTSLLSRKAIAYYKKHKSPFVQAQCHRDYGLLLERQFLTGDARDQFRISRQLFQKIGAMGMAEEIEQQIRGESLPLSKEGAYYPESVSQSADFDVNRLRLEEIYKISGHLIPMENQNALLESILKSLIHTTNAQQGFIMLEESEYLPNFIGIDFMGNLLDITQIAIESELVEKARAGRSIESLNLESDRDKGQSLICAPLWRDRYMGYVYLSNHKAPGIFNQAVIKSVQILSTQTAMLLDYSHRSMKIRNLNSNLDKLVKLQTNELLQKTNSLHKTHKKLKTLHHLKSLLTETIVHDVKNYQAVISSNLKITRKKSGGTPRKEIDLALASCARISSLSSNLIDMAKIEEGKAELKKTYHGKESLCSLFSEFESRYQIILSIKFEVPENYYYEIYWDRYFLTRFISSLVEIKSGAGTAQSGQRFTFKLSEEEVTPYSPGAWDLNLLFCQSVVKAHGGFLGQGPNNQLVAAFDYKRIMLTDIPCKR